MSDVFLIRRYEQSRDEETMRRIVDGTADCHHLYGVEWCESFLSLDGYRAACRFEAPDAEAVRMALRKSGSRDAFPWAGHIHEAPSAGESSSVQANVLVERSFVTPIALEEVQALEDASAWCLEAHAVQALRSFFSLDRKSMICLYRAPDAEAVRLAQRQAGMPFDDVWRFQHLTP